MMSRQQRHYAGEQIMNHKQERMYRLNTMAVVLAAMMFAMSGGNAWASPDMGDHHGMAMQGHDGMGRGGHGNYGMHPHNAAAHFLKMATLLELTDDQVAKLTKMRDDYIANNSTTEEQLKAANDDLPRLLYADEVDLKSVNALFDKIGKMESQLWRAFAQQLHDIKAMLTKEQKASLKEFHEMNHHGMGDMHGDMPMRGAM